MPVVLPGIRNFESLASSGKTLEGRFSFTICLKENDKYLVIGTCALAYLSNHNLMYTHILEVCKYNVTSNWVMLEELL